MKRIIFNGVDFYHQFHAVLEDYDIESPEPKIVKVSVPGRNGDLDMSEALTGTIAYNNRQITVRLGLVGREKHEISLELSDKAADVQCENLQMPTQPIVITTNKTTIQFQTQSITVQAGEHLLPFLFTCGENVLKISGSGMVSIQYQRGVL